MKNLPVSEPVRVLLDEPEGALTALDTGEHASEVAARYPACLTAWAQLGDAALGHDDVTAYACFRVGYHRGLDRLRQAGWRGRGEVPWEHVPNRGFLRALAGLGRAAAALGEAEEADRCREFLTRIAPDLPAEDGS